MTWLDLCAVALACGTLLTGLFSVLRHLVAMRATTTEVARVLAATAAAEDKLRKLEEKVNILASRIR